MPNEILEILKELRGRDIENVYSSIKNYFEYQNFPFQKLDVRSPYIPLFRVRKHQHGEDFFYNESDVSYRRDFINIKEYGRCNEPLQSLFYCSDNKLLSFCEVSKELKKGGSLSPSYYTTSVWRISNDIPVTFLLENENNKSLNYELLKTTLKFKNEVLADPNLLGNKMELLGFLQYISDEFRIKHAKTPDYFLSSAYSNYLLTRITEGGESVKGIIYPTCLGEEQLLNIGLNYVFNTDVVGFKKGIELVDVFRATFIVTDTECNELDVVHCKSIDDATGKITW